MSLKFVDDYYMSVTVAQPLTAYARGHLCNINSRLSEPVPERENEIHKHTKRWTGNEHSHVELLLLVVQLFALHAPLQQRVILLTQHVDLTQQVVVLLLQVTFEATQELRAHTEETAIRVTLCSASLISCLIKALLYLTVVV